MKDPIIDLIHVISNRKKNLPKGSYTAALFKAGLNKICKKVDEESKEVVGAAKHETKKRLIEESVDLIYHLLVLLAAKDIKWAEIQKEIKNRRK